MPNFLDSSGGDENFSEQELKLSYWFVAHKLLLKKILTGILMGAAGILWIYSLIFFIDWAFISGPKERANLKTILQIGTNPGALQAMAAQSIVFNEPQIFSGGVGRYDFLAQAVNPNPDKWRAEFEYRFMGEGLDGGWKKGFILPGEKKYLADLGIERAFRPRNVRLEVQNLKYHRINPHEIPNYLKWLAEHFNMAVTDKVFNSAGIRNNKNIAVLSFKAENNTAYNYWAVGFYAFLYHGDELVAANYLSADKFLSGEARHLQMQFYEGLPSITRYEIAPEFNVFDESGYMEQK